MDLQPFRCGASTLEKKSVALLHCLTKTRFDELPRPSHLPKSHQGLAISIQKRYFACSYKQNIVSEQSEEQHKTRERIVVAAAKILAEKGYEATTLREISREAQVGPGLVHYYFGGKDALLVEVLQAAGQQFHSLMELLVEHLPDGLSLDAFLAQLYERVDLDPDVYRLRYESFSLGLHNPVIAPKVRERLAQRRNEIGSVLARVLEHMEQTESVQRVSLDPTVLAALLLTLFDGLALQKIMDPTFDLEAAYRLLAQALHALLGS
jgi:AcrR family transcriptional regulator